MNLIDVLLIDLLKHGRELQYRMLSKTDTYKLVLK